MERQCHNNDQLVKACIRRQLGTTKSARRCLDILEKGVFWRTQQRLNANKRSERALRFTRSWWSKFESLVPLITYSIDIGVDIFLCIKFYALSQVQISDEFVEDPSKINHWMGWFTFFIPLNRYFMVLACVTCGIIASSHCLMLLIILTSWKGRCLIGLCHHSFLSKLSGSNTCKDKTLAILNCIARCFLLPFYFFSLPLVILKTLRLQRMTSRTIKNVNLAQQERKHLPALEDLIRFGVSLKNDLETAEVTIEAIPQFLIVMLIFLSIPLRGQVLASES